VVFKGEVVDAEEIFILAQLSAVEELIMTEV